MYSDQRPPPPLPEGPPPRSGAYQFGAGEQSQNSPGQNGFTFHPLHAAPQYPVAADQYRPSRTSQYNMEEYRKLHNGDPPRPGKGARKEYQRREPSRPNRGRGRGSYHHRATADRPLLNFKRGSTPEQLLGMNDHEEVEKRFLDIDDMSDSAEEAMDESDPDEYEPPLDIAVPTNGSQAILPGGHAATGFRQAQVHGIDMAATTEDASVPKWSNPEYYTALPPPDESQRKKRDVVKLIRKARVAIEKTISSTNEVAANDDFISFDMGDNQSESDDVDKAEAPRSHGRGVPGASFGPRSGSNYRPAPSSHAPGTNGEVLSAEKLGPPPSNIVSKPKPTQQGTKNTSKNLKRKRSENAVAAEPLRPPKRKKGTAPFSNGYVLEEWEPGDGVNAIPWISSDHRLTENAGFRLHKEICDFYSFVKPQQFEQVVREDLLYRLQHTIAIWQADCKLCCFGSFAAGLYLPNADMDVVVISREFRDRGRQTICQSGSSMHRLARYLQENNVVEPGSVEVISKAKVPLIKFIDRITSLRVDMSFENDTGLVANDTFQSWKQEYPAMPIIVTVIKQFLMMRGLNEVVNGGLGGFSVTCLVTSLLQNMPRVRTKEMVPEHHLGEILLEFLDLYGNQFDLSRTGIQMQPPGYFDKRHTYSYKPSKVDRLAITDPNNPDNDISGGSRLVLLIFARFSRAREEILSAMRSSGRNSLLDWMLGGDYNSFLWQRERLRTIYTKTLGSPQPEDAIATHRCRDTNSSSHHAVTTPCSSPIDVAVPLKKSAKTGADSLPISMAASSSQREKEQDDISTCDSASSHGSPIHSFRQQMDTPIRLQQQLNDAPVKDAVNIEDYRVVAKAAALRNLRAAEEAMKDLIMHSKLKKQQTGKRPKIRGLRRETTFNIDQCRAALVVLPLINIPDPPSFTSEASRGNDSKSAATILLELANAKAWEQLKARNVFKSPTGARLGSDTWNEEFRACLLKSKYPHIPNVPAKLDQSAAKDLLGKHRVDTEKGMTEIEAGLPIASTNPRLLKTRNRRKAHKKAVGGSSKANPITID